MGYLPLSCWITRGQSWLQGCVSRCGESNTTHSVSLQVTFHNGLCCPDMFGNMKQRYPANLSWVKWYPSNSVPHFHRTETRVLKMFYAAQEIHTHPFFFNQMNRSQPVAIQTWDFGMSFGRGSFHESWFNVCTAVNLRKSSGGHSSSWSGWLNPFLWRCIVPTTLGKPFWHRLVMCFLFLFGWYPGSAMII